ncbi:MAG: DUF4835 domain-containing protein [Marinilabiliales bacterium]|nr:MAG: DUF4835 domain-containing protein [Marinilabiliales bacterium]
MHRFFKYLFVFLVCINAGLLSAQELKCRVQVVSNQIQGTNKQIFQTLQSELYEFLNNTKWTKHVYDLDERIECTFLLNLEQQVSADEFKGTLQIQSSRPVYNSTYNSVMFNHKDDDLHFNYIEYQPLEFNESQHTSNLTSILAFYVYYILGLDYDSFAMEGGSEFFQKAEKIVNNAQNAPQSGWKAFEHGRNNRYWLIENIMNNKYSGVREFMYKYHRSGLDNMVAKPNEGRAEIAESLKLIQRVNRETPNLIIIKVIMTAKGDELVNIFSESFPDEKNRVFQILKELDPANTSKYQKILSSQ